MSFTGEEIAEITSPIDIYITTKNAEEKSITSKARDKISHRTGDQNTVECNKLRKRINDTFREKNTDSNAWIDIIIDLGKTADKMQLQSTFCSECAERLHYCRRLFLDFIQTKKPAQPVAEHKSDSGNLSLPAALEKRIEKELMNLKTSREDFSAKLLGDSSATSVAQIEEAIKTTIRNLAYLGSIDELVKLSTRQIKEYYPGTCKGGVSYKHWLTSFIAGKDIEGFEYTNASSIYGATNLSMFVPLVLQQAFSKTFQAKYPPKTTEAKEDVEKEGTVIFVNELPEAVNSPGQSASPPASPQTTPRSTHAELASALAEDERKRSAPGDYLVVQHGEKPDKEEWIAAKMTSANISVESEREAYRIKMGRLFDDLYSSPARRKPLAVVPSSPEPFNSPKTP